MITAGASSFSQYHVWCQRNCLPARCWKSEERWCERCYRSNGDYLYYKDILCYGENERSNHDRADNRPAICSPRSNTTPAKEWQWEWREWWPRENKWQWQRRLR